MALVPICVRCGYSTSGASADAPTCAECGARLLDEEGFARHRSEMWSIARLGLKLVAWFTPASVAFYLIDWHITEEWFSSVRLAVAIVLTVATAFVLAPWLRWGTPSDLRWQRTFLIVLAAQVLSRTTSGALRALTPSLLTATWYSDVDATLIWLVRISAPLATFVLLIGIERWLARVDLFGLARWGRVTAVASLVLAFALHAVEYLMASLWTQSTTPTATPFFQELSALLNALRFLLAVFVPIVTWVLVLCLLARQNRIDRASRWLG